VIPLVNIYVHPTAIIEKNVNLGEGTKVWHYVHIMKQARIGKNCVIGDYVHIGKEVQIGNFVKIENRATIYQGVTVEDQVFIGPHVVFTNDLLPRSSNKDWRISKTIIKKGSSIGAGSVIVCGITIGQYSLVGVGSVVTKNVPSHALVYGNPARIRAFVCECGQKLDEIEKKKNFIFMKCESCKKACEIELSDYVKKEK
jgi:acetyltransferase-like isoleucine patch superfamily enzyme